jgi:hypothetical protein
VRFTFPPGDRAYNELVSAPDLSAIITVDRGSGTIMGVKFLNRGLAA